MLKKYLQVVGNRTNKWLCPFKGLHKAVSKAKEVQIKTSLSIHPLEINNNHPKEAEVVKVLLRSKSEITEKKSINTNSNTRVSPKMRQ